jgi:hypothetical protein
MESTTKTQVWDQDFIFSILSDPIRRGIIVTLAQKGPQTASAFAPVGRNRMASMVCLNRIVKTLSKMRDSGLVVVLPHPTDGRKQLYAITPGIIVTKTEKNCSLEFGTCFVRFGVSETASGGGK